MSASQTRSSHRIGGWHVRIRFRVTVPADRLERPDGPETRVELVGTASDHLPADRRPIADDDRWERRLRDSLDQCDVRSQSDGDDAGYRSWTTD